MSLPPKFCTSPFSVTFPSRTYPPTAVEIIHRNQKLAILFTLPKQEVPDFLLEIVLPAPEGAQN